MLFADPPQHIRLRSLVAKAFASRAIRDLGPRIEQIADTLLDDLTTFDPTRNDTRNIAFGHGIHYYIGAALARMEATIARTRLLARIPATSLDIPATELTWRKSLLIRGLTTLPVHLSSTTAVDTEAGTICDTVDPATPWTEPDNLDEPASPPARARSPNARIKRRGTPSHATTTKGQRAASGHANQV